MKQIPDLLWPKILMKPGGSILFVQMPESAVPQGSLEVENEVWQKIYEINVLSHVYLARAAFPSMMERGAGAFLITASAAGLLTHPCAAPYAATKRAAVALAENLAIEFGERGIYVSCLCPQGVKTRLIRAKKASRIIF